MSGGVNPIGQLQGKVDSNNALLVTIDSGSTGVVLSVTGTANQITASPTTGAVILSIPSTFIAPGSIQATTTLTGNSLTTNTSTVTGLFGTVAAPLALTSITSTVTPFADVNGTTVYPVSQINASFTDNTAATQQVGHYVGLSVNPSAAWTATHVASALRSAISTPVANAQNIDTINGLAVDSAHRGSGTMVILQGATFRSISNAGSGAVGAIQGINVTASATNSSATNGSVISVTALARNNGGGTITNLYGIQAQITNTTSTASGDAAFFRTNGFSNTGTITGVTYGYYVGDITTGTQTGGAFSFYNSDANAPVFSAAAIDGASFKVGGVAGASFGPGPVASITVVNGIITAIS